MQVPFAWVTGIITNKKGHKASLSKGALMARRSIPVQKRVQIVKQYWRENP
jgi:hypothetical protein